MSYLKGEAREQVRALVAVLRVQGKTWRQIQGAVNASEGLSLKRGTIKHMLREVKQASAPDAGTSQGAGTNVDEPVYSESAGSARGAFVTVDERRVQLRQWLGTSYRPEPFMYSPARTERVVIGVGDLHGKPDPSILAEMVHRNADMVIVGGDSTDSRFASQHPSDTRQDAHHSAIQDARQECSDLRAWFETLLDYTTSEIKILSGNHDLWAWKQVSALLPEWALAYYRDPLEMLVSDLGPRVSMVREERVYVYPDGSTDEDVPGNEFVYVLGDVLFSHLNKCSSKTQSGVSKVYRDWFVPWARVLGMAHVRVIVHFHVHQRTLLNEEGGHMTLIEPGMGGLPSTEHYKFGYQAKWRPSVQGFVQLTQYLDGTVWRTDLDSVELVAPHQGRRSVVA